MYGRSKSEGTAVVCPFSAVPLGIYNAELLWQCSVGVSNTTIALVPSPGHLAPVGAYSADVEGREAVTMYHTDAGDIGPSSTTPQLLLWCHASADYPQPRVLWKVAQKSRLLGFRCMH